MSDKNIDDIGYKIQATDIVITVL